MSQRDGAPGPEPVHEIVAICRQVKRKLLKQREVLIPARPSQPSAGRARWLKRRTLPRSTSRRARPL
jgi:hypothetical protein